MAGPELEPRQPTPEQQNVREIPESPEIPEHIERDLGVKPTQHQPKSLQDESGQRMVSTVPTDDVSVISIPADPESATTWSQGSIDDSSTWLGVFVLRRIKQALALGKKVMVKK